MQLDYLALMVRVVREGYRRDQVLSAVWSKLSLAVSYLTEFVEEQRKFAIARRRYSRMSAEDVGSGEYYRG
jgi:hypothetical protein